MTPETIDNDLFRYADQLIRRGAEQEKVAKLLLAAAAKYRFLAHARCREVTSPDIVAIEAEVVEAGLEFVQAALPHRVKLL